MANKRLTLPKSWPKFASLINAIVICLVGMATIVFVSESCSKAKFESLRQDNHVVFIDFFKYYICGKLASAHDIHDRHSPYDPNVQYKYLASYANATDRQKVEYIEYPPQDFVLMMPLAQLPPHQAYIAFVLANALLGSGGLLYLCSVQKKGWRSICYILAALACAPMFRAVTLGQPTFGLLGLIALYIATWQRKRDLAAGLLLAVIAIKPQYAVFMGVQALAARRYKIVLVSLLAMALLLIVAACVIGPQNIWTYPSVIANAARAADLAGSYGEQMANLRAMLMVLAGLDKDAALTACSFACAVSLVALFIICSVTLSTSNKPAANPALAIVFALYFSPHVHIYDTVLLILLAITAPANAVILTTSMSILPLASWLPFFLPHREQTGITLPFAFVDLAVLLLALGALASQPVTKGGASRGNSA